MTNEGSNRCDWVRLDSHLDLWLANAVIITVYTLPILDLHNHFLHEQIL